MFMLTDAKHLNIIHQGINIFNRHPYLRLLERNLEVGMKHEMRDNARIVKNSEVT